MINQESKHVSAEAVHVLGVCVKCKQCDKIPRLVIRSCVKLVSHELGMTTI